MLSRLEERIQLSAEKPSQIRPFSPITLRAGVTEAIWIVGASVLLGNDVFDLEGKRSGVFFTKMAVFAATACPLPDEGPERGVHHSPVELARSWRAFDFRIATNVSK